MSSAILYVAIVAIWAGVLIPRWLRRDSAAGGRNSEHVAAADAKPEKPHQVCVTAKVGRLFGHDVTHVKCEDAKPAPAKPASEPA